MGTAMAQMFRTDVMLAGSALCSLAGFMGSWTWVCIGGAKIGCTLQQTNKKERQ